MEPAAAPEPIGPVEEIDLSAFLNEEAEPAILVLDAEPVLEPLLEPAPEPMPAVAPMLVPIAAPVASPSPSPAAPAMLVPVAAPIAPAPPAPLIAAQAGAQPEGTLPGSTVQQLIAIPTADGTQVQAAVNVAVAVSVQVAAAVNVTTAPKRPAKPKPVQDEWGFFDPGQCGFPALMAKLDEIASNEDN